MCRLQEWKLLLEKYVAYRNEFTGLIQTVKAHCENTAKLCREFSVPVPALLSQTLLIQRIFVKKKRIRQIEKE